MKDSAILDAQESSNRRTFQFNRKLTYLNTTHKVDYARNYPIFCLHTL